ANVILNLKNDWPDLLIINGRARHPQSQGLVERANAVVQQMLGKWLDVNKTSDWPSGLGPVMLSINNCTSQSTKKTPYEMVFGQPCRIDHEFWLELHKELSTSDSTVNEEDLLDSFLQKLNTVTTSVSINMNDQSQISDETSTCISSIDSHMILPVKELTETSHKRIRDEAEKNYIHTAERQLKIYERALKKQKSFEINDIIGLKIADVDRSNTAPSILPCKIIKIIKKDDPINVFYKLATQDGIISELFSSSEFMDLTQTVSSDLRKTDITQLANITFIQACQIFTKFKTNRPCKYIQINMDDEISHTLEQIVDGICVTTTDNSLHNTVEEDDHNDKKEDINISQTAIPTTVEPTLININDINTDITFLWKILAFVTCIYPKRTFTNGHGTGEISNWDLTDQSGSITLVAFNLNSHIMADKLKKNQAYEFTNLTIKSAVDIYKTLPHPFQLTCTNGTRVREIDPPFVLEENTYNFTPLNQINSLPMNSIIDVEVRVLRDFGISTGTKNETIWSRRDIHVDQDGSHIGMTLWNEQARLVKKPMINDRIRFKNVKISWFDGIIETDTNSRRFCYLTLDELINVYQSCPVSERSIYELICSEQHVKAYIDFEYYINCNSDTDDCRIGPICCLKILHLLLNFDEKFNYNQNINIDFIFQKFLVLEASTSQKISYHFIHTNENILFDNNQTFGLFFKVTIHFFLWMIIKHKCTSFHITQSLEKCTIPSLIDFLGKYVNLLRTSCRECYIYSKFLTVAEVAYLLVLNKENQYTLAIDLGVYSKNQQFRLFDCVKKQKANALIQSLSLTSAQSVKYSYNEILKNSLLTYHEKTNVFILSEKDNQFVYEELDIVDKSIFQTCELINVNKLNHHMKNFYLSSTNYTNRSNRNRSNFSSSITRPIKTDLLDTTIEKFKSFVEKLITSDPSHLGYIRSYVHGNHNSDVIFFNIGGEYRFCPLINRHHKRNTSAIFIDINNRTFTIRCKDPDCKHTNLFWHKIE
ncbi:unnamed protein product, partial [Rotaria sp. Silwood1]